jgi:hypothetical protein
MGGEEFGENYKKEKAIPNIAFSEYFTYVN